MMITKPYINLIYAIVNNINENLKRKICFIMFGHSMAAHDKNLFSSTLLKSLFRQRNPLKKIYLALFV